MNQFLNFKSNIFYATLICFLTHAHAPALANSPISANAIVDKPRATIGDIITYTVTVRHDAGMEPSMPDFSGIAGFEVLASQDSGPRKVEGQIEREFSVKLRADRVGLYTLPPIMVPFEVAAGEGDKTVPGEIRTPEVTIDVQSILRLQGDPTDIRDIKDAVAVDRDWASWLFIALNVLLLLTLLYLLWKYRKQKHEPSAPKPLDLPPHEIALKELDALKRRELLESGSAREHFFELSEIFRRYLGERYHFPALDWTTEEITAKFDALPELEPEARKEAVRILMKSDLIKFAKVEAAPGSDEIEPVRTLIESTREHLAIGLYS